MWQISKRVEVHIEFGGEGRNLRERHHLEDLGTNGTITLKQNTEIGWDRIDWTDLAADSNKWQGAVNVVMNLWIPQNAGEILTTLAAVCSQAGLCSIDLVGCLLACLVD